MEKYKVIINPTAEKDFSKHKKAGNAATIKKIFTILNELKEGFAALRSWGFVSPKLSIKQRK